MERINGRDAAKLPPTVNMHIIGTCNYGCKFCYAPFVDRQNAIPLEDGKRIIDLLAGHGVTRITFAGGEPTLHRNLLELLTHARCAGIVTAVVTNASMIDEAWCQRFLPELRWLVLSLDSADPKTCDAIGRQKKNGQINHPRQIANAVRLVRQWNSANPDKPPVLIKINIVVTPLNAGEDPTPLLLALYPDRIKLLSCGIRPGENDDAEYLRCPPEKFTAYCKRVGELEQHGITVVAEDEDDQLGSYAMIDPAGCFYQSGEDARIAVSDPILDVGLMEAWQQVGGIDFNKFVARGGQYDPGLVPSGRVENQQG
jgi:radical S-adenosyl methionine domain-containing protein 2